MAILFYLGQVPAQWFTEAGDSALSGGKLQFFDVGTSTPKAVYSDYQGLTAIGTTVTLDASGRANVWLSGLYRVQLLTAANVPIGNHVDGIGIQIAANVGASSVLSVETYTALRALDGDDVRVVAVEGRAANGDGGAGLFAWDAADTTTDDGGTILTPASNPASGRWVRIFSGDMDLRWFGNLTGTDDTTAYALGLAASVTRQRWLSIHNGTARLTSTVAAPVGSMVRIPIGGKLVAASAAIAVGFPSGSLFDGSPGCFGENLTVSFGLNAVPAVDVDWWDVVDDDTRLDEAGSACAAANMEVLIPRAMLMTANYTQPSNAILRFRGPGRLSWSGSGAVTVYIGLWVDDRTDAPRFTFSSVSKLAAINFLYHQSTYLPPTLFGASGGSGAFVDEDFALWPAFLHGKVWIDRSYLLGSSISLPGSLYIRGPLENARDIADATVVPHGLFLGAGVDLDAAGDLSFSGTCIEATNATQSEVTAGGVLTLHRCAVFGQDNGGVASLGFQAVGASIADSQTTCAPVYATTTPSIRDSDVYGAASYTVSAVDRMGIAGSSWAVDRCYIEDVLDVGVSRIADSEMPSVGSLAYSGGCVIRDSTVTPASTASIGVSSGTLSIHGGAVTLPLIAEDGHTVTIDAFRDGVTMPWNGYGEMTITGGVESVKNGGITSDNASRRCALVVDGVAGPRSRSSALDTVETATSATSNWAFGSVATPTVTSDAFYWAAGLAASGTHTIDKTVTTDAEKILMAYGGYVIAEWTGDIDSVTCLAGVEAIAVATCPGATGQRAIYHVWPGAPTATTTYGFRVVHGAGSATLKITLQPCAPINSAQWETFWGGDRTLSASCVNTWKSTYTDGSDCAALEVLVDTLPVTPFTPSLQTIQPWLLTLPAPVRAYPRNQVYYNNILTGNPIMASKEPSGSSFHPIVCGAQL